jgi:outer membrane receptor protein involved in Fe transport
VNLINARGGNAYGMEADAQWAVTENLTLNAGASWTRTAIRDTGLSVPPCAAAPGVALASLGCTPLNAYNRPLGTVSINNNPFPQAPDYTLQLGAAYSLPLDNGARIVASTDWWFQGYTNFFLYKSKEFHSNGNFEGGLRLGYVFPGGIHEVAVYGRNITDQQNVQGAIDFNNLTGFVGDPRVVGAEYRFHIGQ